MSLDLPIKEAYDAFTSSDIEIDNFFMVFIPEEVRSSSFLPFGRINQIDQGQGLSASNQFYSDNATIQIDLWSTDLSGLNENNKKVDELYNSLGWKCIFTDLDEDKDSIFESVYCYRLIKRYKKSRLY